MTNMLAKSEPAAVMGPAEAFAIDLAERIGSTFIQVFLATVLATSTGAAVAWGDAAAVAAFAAITALLTTVLVWAGALPQLASPYADLGYRTVITFGQTLVGMMLAAGVISALSFDWNLALKAALAAAATALLKGLIGLSRPTLGAAVFTPPVPLPVL